MFLSYTIAEMARTKGADIRVLSVRRADARRLGIMRISPKGYPYISERMCQVLNAEQLCLGLNGSDGAGETRGRTSVGEIG